MWNENLKCLHVHKSSKKGKMKIKLTVMLVTFVEDDQE
jgi:hypothetical protein